MSFSVSISSQDWSSVYNNTALSFTYKLPRQIELNAAYEVAVVDFQIISSTMYKRRMLHKKTTLSRKPVDNHRSYVLCCNIVPDQCVRETLLPAIYEFHSIHKVKQRYIRPLYLQVQPSLIDTIQFQLCDTAGERIAIPASDVAETLVLLHFQKIRWQ